MPLYSILGEYQGGPIPLNAIGRRKVQPDCVVKIADAICGKDEGR